MGKRVNLVVHSYHSPASADAPAQNSYLLVYPKLGACAIVDPPRASSVQVLEALCACIERHNYLPTWILHTLPDGPQARSARQLQAELICARSALASPQAEASSAAGANEPLDYDLVLHCGDRIRVGNAFGRVTQLGVATAYVFDQFVFAAQPCAATGQLAERQILPRIGPPTAA